MRTTPIVAAISAVALFVACGGEESTAPPTCVAPDMEITTCYWEDGDWVRHAAWDASFLGSDVRIWIDVANWRWSYSAFWVELDNIYAYGDLNISEGLLDGFEDGVISPIWGGTGESCQLGGGPWPARPTEC